MRLYRWLWCLIIMINGRLFYRHRIGQFKLDWRFFRRADRVGRSVRIARRWRLRRSSLYFARTSSTATLGVLFSVLRYQLTETPWAKIEIETRVVLVRYTGTSGRKQSISQSFKCLLLSSLKNLNLDEVQLKDKRPYLLSLLMLRLL